MSLAPQNPPVLDPEAEVPNIYVGYVHREGSKSWNCTAVDQETYDGTWAPILGEFPFDPQTNQLHTIGAKTFKYTGSNWEYVDLSDVVIAKKFYTLEDNILAENTSGGSSIIQKATVTLTATQLANLHNTPIELVPAPGEGKIIALMDAFAFGAGFVENAGAIAASLLDYSANDLWYENDYMWNMAAKNGLTRSGNVGYRGAPDARNSPIVLRPFSGGVYTNPLPIPGAIVASSLNNGGSGWQVNDTFKVGDADGVVDSTSNPYYRLTQVGYFSGSGLSVGDTVSIEGDSGGAQNVIVASVDNSGHPTAFTIGAGGGFQSYEAYFSAFKNGVLVAATVNAILAPFGTVATYHFTNPGTNNLVATGVAATDASGSGTDLTLNITEVDASNNPCTLKITALYSVIDI